MAEIKMDVSSLDNSYESRENKDAEKHLKPVVSGSARVVKKETIGHKFRNAFISEDMKDVSDYIFLDIIVPGIKNAVLDTLERIFFSSGGGSRRDRRDDRDYGKTSYTSYYRESGSKRRHRDRRDDRDDRLDKTDYRRIIVTHREDAEEIVRQMRDYIREYDSVSVARLLDLIDEPGKYTDNNWGWTREEDIGIRRVREGYLIDVREAEYLGD